MAKAEAERDALEDAHDRIEMLEQELAKLDFQMAEAKTEADNTLANQLDSLAVAVESGSPSLPKTPEQWSRCLKQIAGGGDWQNGTWK